MLGSYGRRPLAGGVGMSGELRLDRGCGTKGFVIKGVEILAHRPRRIVGIAFTGGPVLRIARILFLNISVV